MQDEDASNHRIMQVQMAFTKKGWFGKIRTLKRIQVWYKLIATANCYVGFLELCVGGQLVIELTHGIHAGERYQVNYDGSMVLPKEMTIKLAVMTPRIQWWLK